MQYEVHDCVERLHLGTFLSCFKSELNSTKPVSSSLQNFWILIVRYSSLTLLSRDIGINLSTYCFIKTYFVHHQDIPYEVQAAGLPLRHAHQIIPICPRFLHLFFQLTSVLPDFSRFAFAHGISFIGLKTASHFGTRPTFPQHQMHAYTPIYRLSVLPTHHFPVYEVQNIHWTKNGLFSAMFLNSFGY